MKKFLHNLSSPEELNAVASHTDRLTSLVSLSSLPLEDCWKNIQQQKTVPRRALAPAKQYHGGSCKAAYMPPRAIPQEVSSTVLTRSIINDFCCNNNLVLMSQEDYTLRASQFNRNADGELFQHFKKKARIEKCGGKYHVGGGYCATCEGHVDGEGFYPMFKHYEKHHANHCFVCGEVTIGEEEDNNISRLATVRKTRTHIKQVHPEEYKTVKRINREKEKEVFLI